MKKLNNIALIILFTVAASFSASAQNKLKVSFRYFMFNNKIPYLTIQTKTKVDGKLLAVSGVAMNVYMDEESPKNIIAKVTTNLTGDAVAVIPKELKQLWDSSPKHKFIAVSAATKENEESNSEMEITKAKILIDTLRDGDVKNIAVTVLELKDNNWVAVKDVEAKAGVCRHASVLTVGKEQTYTTDSTGKFLAEFKREALPGDENGNIKIVAKVEDNDAYGNLIIEKTVPWGIKIDKPNDFEKRSLFSTRFRTPVWLLFMAYTVIGIVWGVLIYLIVVIVKVMKIGFNTKD
ncbi:MAG: hypothetical protein WCO54_01685 [Bacteroidota bacterium]